MAASQQIPRLQSDNQDIVRLQTNILQVINPLLKTNPILFGNTLKSVSLNVGDNNVNTGLQSPLQGWIIIRKRGPAAIYDKQDSNTAQGTLLLNSDTAVSIDLIAF